MATVLTDCSVPFACVSACLCCRSCLFPLLAGLPAAPVPPARGRLSSLCRRRAPRSSLVLRPPADVHLEWVPFDAASGSERDQWLACGHGQTVHPTSDRNARRCSGRARRRMTGGVGNGSPQVPRTDRARPEPQARGVLTSQTSLPADWNGRWRLLGRSSSNARC